MNSRAQASLEYLMTYGWALILVATLVGIFVFTMKTPSGNSFNSSDPTKFLLKGATSYENKMELVLQNITGGDIELTDIRMGCEVNGQIPRKKKPLAIKAGGIMNVECFRNLSVSIQYTDFAGLPKNVEIETGSDSKELKIWAFSDTHFHNPSIVKTEFNWPVIFAERLDNMEGQYDVGMIMGDIVHFRTLIDEITEVNRILEETNAKSRFLPLTGNHDMIDGGGVNLVGPYYLENFSPSGQYHFTRQIGNILFIALGEEGCTGPCTLEDSRCQGPCDEPTFEWFNQTVADNQDKIIIVGTHEHIKPDLYTWSYGIPMYKFQETFDNYDIDLWLYGHTHGFNKKELEFTEGRKTLFINTGKWECNYRSCSIMNGYPDMSVLMTFTEDSNTVSLKKIYYRTEAMTTPEFEDRGSFQLSKAFKAS